ncbi:hypothetical protein BOX15_Mlig011793g3 [Macrostomum lignano]|nr:hypothetical protein BOX15_Mlig011793g1 [Macrostomum lignano]PAA77649.1 hypothetical protein BOX15_Mlig011793g3 [Macrostomum lignano]
MAPGDLLLTACILAAAVSLPAAKIASSAPSNPSHEPLRRSIRAALDPSRTEALEEAAEAAIAESGGSRQVEKLLALSYSEFGSMAKVQPFNRLLANNTDNFVPLVLSLLGADSRHLADFRELAFPELANGTGPEGWRLHKLAHWPKDGRSSGTKLSCLLVAPAGPASYDLVLVISATAPVQIGDRDLLVAETKLAEQLGWPDRRESRLARVGHEAGLSESDLDGLMAFAELNCLRKLGAYFEVALDS